MIKKPIVAANWKMYKTPKEGVSFVSEISNLLLDKEKPTIIMVLYPYSVLGRH